MALTAGDHAELDLLDTLERGLSSAYTLFHSVDWSKSSGEREQHGEIDIVVVNQAGDVLLMEVKSGGVDFRPEGIFKAYGVRSKDVTARSGSSTAHSAHACRTLVYQCSCGICSCCRTCGCKRLPFSGRGRESSTALTSLTSCRG